MSLFLSDIFDQTWNGLELKQRMRHITKTINKHLHSSYEDNVETILSLIPILRKNGFKDENLEFIFLPDYNYIVVDVVIKRTITSNVFYRCA